MAAVAGPSLGMSVATFGVFVTAFYVSYVFSNATGGFLTDSIGPRLAILLALIPFGIFTFLFSYTSSLLVGVIIQVGMGLTAGVNYTACVKLVTSWFPLQRRGKPMALFLVGASLGLTLTNGILPTLLHHFG
jgi:sugar phosphate permease